MLTRHVSSPSRAMLGVPLLMEQSARIREKIRAFYRGMTGLHHRYRSWEHCFGYFHRLSPVDIANDREHAALQLGFYLASWGMYRGSSFLLQHAYTIHLGVIDQIVAPKFSVLWEHEFGAGEQDSALVPVILEAFDAIREAYGHFGLATDTLVTKVLLGTFGCLPACDKYFIEGFKSAGFQYSYVNARFVGRVLRFCKDANAELREEQQEIEKASGVHYPLMKLVDMYFWQIGIENVAPTSWRVTP
jgi:hypothetical protein